MPKSNLLALAARAQTMLGNARSGCSRIRNRQQSFCAGDRMSRICEPPPSTLLPWRRVLTNIGVQLVPGRKRTKKSPLDHA